MSLVFDALMSEKDNLQPSVIFHCGAITSHLLLDATWVDSRFKIILISNKSCINVAPRFTHRLKQRRSCCSFLSLLRAAHLCCCRHSWEYTASHCSWIIFITSEEKLVYSYTEGEETRFLVLVSLCNQSSSDQLHSRRFLLLTKGPCGELKAYISTCKQWPWPRCLLAFSSLS